MRTDRLIISIQSYKKPVVVLLAIFFSFSLVVIALDQHFQGFSKSCLICRTKSSINGIAASFVLEFNPIKAYCVLDEYLLTLTIHFLSHSQNKSPPQIIS